jgi:RimJ/RimL family protein N-acetyltransferase
VLKYGREVLNFERVLAITSLDNESSGKLLLKLGFTFNKIIDTPEGERLNLYSFLYPV